MTLTVLHVVNDLQADGAQTCLYRLIAGRDPRSFRHVVATLLDDGSRLRDALADQEVEVVSLGLTHSPASLPGAVRRLLWTVRRLRPNVVQGWMYHGNLFALLAKVARPGASLVWSIRVAPEESEGHVTLHRLARAGAAFSWVPRAIIYNAAVSAEIHRRAGFPARKARVIHNGIAAAFAEEGDVSTGGMRAQEGVEASRVVVSYVKRYHPDKGHDILLESMRRLVADHPQILLWCVGRGVDDPQSGLDRRVREMGLEDHVQLFGEVPDVREVYASTDVAVSASPREGFPNAVMEAMAMGCPCVVTDAGDSRYLVDDAGMVVPARDAAALAEAIGRVVRMDPAERSRLGEAARARVLKHFSLAGMVDAYERVYREAAKVGRAS